MYNSALRQYLLPSGDEVLRIYAREQYCIGCRLCEIHCAVVHSLYPDNIIKAYKQSPAPPQARIVVEEEIPVSFALQCRHCDDPECVKACITGAMAKDWASGAVLNDQERCVGCWSCISVCPYGAVSRANDGRKVATKCDLCMQLEAQPICVTNCPNRALILLA